MSMIRFIIIALALSCTLCVSAQSIKEWEREINKNKELVKELEKNLQNVREDKAKIERRKLVVENPEQSLRKSLASYKDIKEMAEKNIFNEKPEYKNLPFAKSYITLIRMYNSLGKNGGYKQEENEAFKSELDAIKVHIMSLEPKHEESFMQSFDDLDNCIRNYRFAMFELARIFVLVEEKEKEGIKPESIYTSLQDDEETSFVDQTPYTQIALKTYCARPDKRSEILRKLKASCAEAFKNFK